MQCVSAFVIYFGIKLRKPSCETKANIRTIAKILLYIREKFT
jgi:hypothetical protein